jgi:hypothetical protein
MEIVWQSPLEVIAIEAGDAAGWLEAATTLGEVEFTSLQSFVDNVIAFAQGVRIRKLHLQAHGNSEVIEFGSDLLTLANFNSKYRGLLSRLTPLFDKGAVVVLRACEVGQNVALLQNLAGAWNVTVISGRGFQNNLYNFNTGRYVVVAPNGAVDTSLFLPVEAKYEKDGADQRIGQKLLQKMGINPAGKVWP